MYLVKVIVNQNNTSSQASSVFWLFGLGSVSYMEAEEWQKMGKACVHMRWTRGGRRGGNAQLQMRPGCESEFHTI